MPELLSPAGGFSAGYYAIEAGADAVYLGLKSFSARKGARNFAMGEVARLKAFAGARGRRVYVAFNTVIRDDELGEAAGLLYDLESIGVDGVIVQDLGLVRVLRRDFPGLAVHASTQMAVHNASGVEVLRRLGVGRVILARELTIEEIRWIHGAHPDVELEVFVHGALCYGFSGLCLMSGLVTGRSANRGECAQLCRGLFEWADPSARTKSGQGSGYWFSMNDLAAGDLVHDLAAAGVSSLKIEGRMKAPEYVRSVTAYYRGILDGAPSSVTEGHLQNARLIFSRRPTRGHLGHAPGAELTNPAFPGHLGVPAGRVEEVVGGWFRIRLNARLALRDGLQAEDSAGRRRQPFGVDQISRAGPTGKSCFEAGMGESVWVEADAEVRAGDLLYKTSSSASALPEPKPGAFSPAKVSIVLEVELGPTEIRLSVARYGIGLTVAVGVQPARNSVPLETILGRYLQAPGDSRFAVESIEVSNRSGLPDDGVYLNPTELKAARRRLFIMVEEAYGSHRGARAAGAVAGHEPTGLGPAFEPPTRDRLSWRGLPFAAETTDGVAGDSARAAVGAIEYVFVPLPPVLYDESGYFKELDGLVASVEKNCPPSTRLALGLCNIGHLVLSTRYATRERVWFFADYGLYVANRAALAFLYSAVPRLLFVYPWIEDPGALSGAPVVGPLGGYGDFSAPLFLSRTPPAANMDPPSLSRPVALRQGKRRFLLYHLGRLDTYMMTQANQ